jgi:endoglucanase
MSKKYLETLTALCNLPTAPYCEEHVIAWLLAWARERAKWIKTRRDRAGNVYLEYGRGRKTASPLVIEAHMDHPGFALRSISRSGGGVAEFRGGVRPSCFEGARAKFRLDGAWTPAKVVSVAKKKKEDYLEVKLKFPAGTKAEKNAIGMWDLPDAKVKGEIFSARVCDDIAGVAAAICMLEELIEKKIETHVIVLLSRAEEVGFAGVLAVVKNGWIPRKSPVIGLETSKAFATSPQGAGVIIRVGDRTGIFSAGLTHFVSQAAGHIGDDDSAFKYQRKLMDGGTCNSTAFFAFGYDATGICVALGNYHNQTVKGEIGWNDGSRAGPAIGSETIHLGDFEGEVRLLVEVARTIHKYKPGFGAVRERLEKLHREQEKRLYGTADGRR